MNKLIITLASAMLCMISGCGGDNEGSRLDDGAGTSSSMSNASSSSNDSSNNNSSANSDLPDTPFSERSVYVLADFDLQTDSAYWEVRWGPIEGSGVENEPEEVLYSYDSNATDAFTELQTEALAEAESSSGFGEGCLPMSCPIYGVAIEGDEARLLTSENELLAFFSDLNTEAELNLWLYANEYDAQTYSEVAGGYEVVAAWDDNCEENGEDLLFVDTNGVITILETLWSEENDICA